MLNRDKSRITASEMRFMRHPGGYTKWDHKRNEDILHELHMYSTILKYRPSGKRSLGYPLKRWTENFM